MPPQDSAPAGSSSEPPGQCSASGMAAPSAPSTSGRCVILYEPMPLPLAARAFSGRMSFQGMNPTIERKPAPSGEDGAAAGAAAAADCQPQEGASISDRSMADRMGGSAFKKPAKPWDKAWEGAGLKMYGGSDDAHGGDGAQAEGQPRPQKKHKANSHGGGSDKAGANANAFAPLRPARKPKH